jgi:D-beta-D-heptose 7-phosphate kinase/D-beta-D-heptose 1-phosphate adenosyltransferase
MPGPVVDIDTLRALIEVLPGRRVVLTNGVFDLLHVGHLRYLRQARELGDVLVVGVNADTAVHKPGRPLVPDAERAELVAALEPVDYVVIFAEATADGLLRAVRPDVYAKGADYSAETLPEAATAREVGARLVFLPLVPDRSTTVLASARLPRPDSARGTCAGCSASAS